MRRTSILIPSELRNRADQRCRRLGISFGELVRRALDEHLSRGGAGDVSDPLFADGAVYTGEAPEDTAKNHDEYLYGGES